jgi:hypothetical protein
MVSVVWGTHALPVYWEVLKKPGNSDLRRFPANNLPIFRGMLVKE